ncbi:unnamed protein product [Gongylonema pulchrum]|uniref:Uncharacterized protein n=1 Tax=Gongylonema pulchrum TaxID=637853 RepID=A0A183EZ67_9BILA|nr:unnamed protein product [Gongylonema pulchrum]
MPNVEADPVLFEDSILQQELLFDIVNEAKTTNEIEIQKRLRQCRRRSAAVEAQALKESRQSFELTDEELLKAFTDAKD